MLAPILKPISSFDAHLPITFFFDWNGNQSYGSVLTIRNNETDAIVSTTTFTTMRLEHTLPADQLTNGVCYKATLVVKNSSGTIISDQSNAIRFYCFTTPTFEFSNLVEDQIIGNSSYTFTLAYSQLENENIKEYYYRLFDVGQTEIYYSGIRYVQGSDVTIDCLITGLSDQKTYYIEAQGITQNGMLISTGIIRFSVDYLNPSIFMPIEVTNHSDRGYITVESHVTAIEARGEGDYDFVDDSKIDLTAETAKVIFDDLQFPDNWTIFLVGESFPENEPILTLHFDINMLNLVYRKGQFLSQDGDLKGYFELIVSNTLGNATYYSNYVTPLTDGDIVTIKVSKQNGVYVVEAEEAEE